MKPVLSAGWLLFMACIGAACVRSSAQWLSLVLLLVLGLGLWGRAEGWPRRGTGSLALMLCLVTVRCGIAAEPQPQLGDPSLLIPGDGKPLAVHLVGRVHADGAVDNGHCRTLLEVSSLNGQLSRGRTELTLEPCTTPLLTGSWLELEGEMRRPQPASHPLLARGDERLALQRTWSRLRANAVHVVRQDWTPLSDARRRIAQRFLDAAGEREGGFLAALVLGGAQVSVPQSVRDAFRVAGLSHALAASGFHLSVLLGSAMACTRSLPAALRLASGSGAMALFLCLAGAQPSVVRAVLMGAAALLIRESGHRCRPLGVLLVTLVLMLLVHPTWGRSIGFQLSAAATAGLVISAGPLEQWIIQNGPRRLQRLAPALSIPLAAPLLAPLTLAAMALAVMVLLLPAALSAALLPWMIWPVQQLSWWLISLVNWISQWPGAQLLTGPVHPLLVLLFALGLLPWLLPAQQRWRGLSLLWLLLAVCLQVHVQLRDDLIRVEQWGRQWLVLRHRGRAALLSSHGDELSCRIATRLSHGLGHQRLDWIAVLDPVGTDQQLCWNALARTLQVEQRGRLPLTPGQRLQSDGLSVGVADQRGRMLNVRFGTRVQRLRRSDLRPQSG